MSEVWYNLTVPTSPGPRLKYIIKNKQDG